MTPTSLLILVIASGAALAEPSSAQGRCDQLARPGGLQLDETHIGPFPIAAPLDSLRRMCPEAQPTLGHGFETAWAALDLSIGDLQILAGQNWLLKMLFDAPGTPDPVPDWSRSPSHWVVSGCGAVLPRGVSSCGTWAELVAAYGAAGSGTTEFGPAVVTLAGLPGFTFHLDVTDSVVGSLEVQPDLSRVPGTARITSIIIATP
jgi:hypothetical protein